MAAQGLPAGLLAQIETALDITWSDAGTDAKIMSLAEDGITYLNNKAGSAQNYLEPGIARTLLFAWVRYARDNATDVFENNYLSLIIAMQSEAELHVETGEQTDA